MIRFINFWKLYLTISAVVISAGLISIFTWGYTYSIDFVGGTNVEYDFGTQVDRKFIEKIASEQSIEIINLENRSDTSVFLRTSAIDEQKEASFRNALQLGLKTPVTIIRTETVGPVIGVETLRKTAIATGLAVLGILLYIAYAFRNIRFALSAILALIHDVLVVAGMYSILSHFPGAELDILFVTALLTTMAFSVHDTIVLFDQIREYRKQNPGMNIKEQANRAITTTMVRSLNNSFTIMFMLIALILLGGDTIRFFAVTLLIGTITGTYSSPFVSVPIAVWLENKSSSRTQSS